MTDGMYTLTNLHSLFDHDALKLASAEAQLESILPDWIIKSNALPLKSELQLYLGIVKQHRLHLQEFLKEEDIQKLSRTNMVMAAHIAEGREQLCNCMENEVKDASLLASVQGINHYKISLYGTAAAFSRSLGKGNAARIFHDAMLNEKDVDKRLSALAEQEINQRATPAGGLPTV